MILSRTILNLVMLATLIMAGACTRAVKEERLIAERPRFEMLIAADTSEFKDAVRERLLESYRGEGNITLMGVDGLRTIDPAAYDVILIMDTCLAWTHFNPSLMTFLADSPKLTHVVLLITAGDQEWTFSQGGLDAVTAASETENEERVAARLKEQIEGILANPR